MKTLEINPCPFCGNTRLDVSDESIYYELLNANGTACIVLRCDNCCTEMYEHTYHVRDYNERVKMLIDKWNRRTSDENARTGKNRTEV